MARMSEPVESLLLGGKVRKWALPLVPGGRGGERPRLKRLVLPQGELAQFYDSEEGIRYIAMIQLRAGNSRGNHYHKVKREYLYMIEGEARLVVENVETRERATVPLRTGDVAFIETGVAHALEVVEPGLAVEFSAARFDAADIYRVKLVE